MNLDFITEKDWGWNELNQRMKDLAIVIANPNLPDCPIVFCNNVFLEHCGYSLEEIIGRNCRFMQGQDTEQEAVHKLRKAIYERASVNVVITNYRKDGTVFKNSVLMKPLGNNQELFVAVQKRVS